MVIILAASLEQLQRQRTALVQEVTELGQDYQRMKQSLGPRIQRLQAEADDLARQFKPLVQQAVDAYSAGRKTEAKQLSERRKALQSQSEARNAEANVLRQELAAALQDLHSAEAKLKELNEDIRRFEQSGLNHDGKRAIAQRAGVPYHYLDNVLVSRQADGMIHIYFGGVGKPDGPGHGHYVMDQYDRVVYRQEPFDEHGAQVFEDEVSYIQQQRGQGHRGGFGIPVHGSIDGRAVTVAFGWGTREGETLLADGHVDRATFKQHGNHNHYGSGSGPHGNVKERFRYSGAGS